MQVEQQNRNRNDIYNVAWSPNDANNELLDKPLPLFAGMKTVPFPWPSTMFGIPSYLGRCAATNTQVCRCPTGLSCKFHLNDEAIEVPLGDTAVGPTRVWVPGEHEAFMEYCRTGRHPALAYRSRRVDLENSKKY